MKLLYLILILLPCAAYGQAPNLGTAAAYVFFSSTGAVLNTGQSHIRGSVGTRSGTLTMNTNVDGVLHNADAASIQAAADVLSADSQLTNTAITYTFPATAGLTDTLGRGDSLLPGVYAVSKNTLLDSTLILDAAGDSGAIFIFKINGTLSSLSNTRIILANGAQAANVYWQTSGDVNLAGGTSMRGTIIARSAAIDLGVDPATGLGVALEGRALTATAGAITIRQVAAGIPSVPGAPLSTGPVAPALGAVSCYGLFSGNGAVTNTGITNVVGDVGTNVTFTAGFDSARVAGTIHPLPDISTSAANNALTAVHSYLYAIPADIELMDPADFGKGLVLTPHTYLLNAATTLTDTLYLDAMGNPDAVFIIKITGALTTSSSSAAVLLINGAQAKNVYWNVEGSITFTGSARMAGTFVANNNAIAMASGAQLDGRALTTNGALGTTATNTTMDGTACSNFMATALPLSWLYFRGSPQSENVVLTWATASERNSAFFTLERSADARNYEVLASVTAVGAPGSTPYNYSFTDRQPLSAAYYRISHTDNDGIKTYYNTILVKAGTHDKGITAVHYTEGNTIYIKLSGTTPGSASIALYSMDGRKVSVLAITTGKEPITYQVQKPSASGIYMLHIEGNGVGMLNDKVVVR